MNRTFESNEGRDAQGLTLPVFIWAAVEMFRPISFFRRASRFWVVSRHLAFQQENPSVSWNVSLSCPLKTPNYANRYLILIAFRSHSGADRSLDSFGLKPKKPNFKEMWGIWKECKEMLVVSYLILQACISFFKAFQTQVAHFCFVLHKSADVYMCSFWTNCLTWVPENTDKKCVPQIAIWECPARFCISTSDTRGVAPVETCALTMSRMSYFCDSTVALLLWNCERQYSYNIWQGSHTQMTASYQFNFVKLFGAHCLFHWLGRAKRYVCQISQHGTSRVFSGLVTWKSGRTRTKQGQTIKLGQKSIAAAHCRWAHQVWELASKSMPPATN